MSRVKVIHHIHGNEARVAPTSDDQRTMEAPSAPTLTTRNELPARSRIVQDPGNGLQHATRWSPRT